MLETDDVRTLVDLGFIALSRGLDRHADAIFAGVRVARPGQEAGILGGALVAMLRGDLAAAVKALRTIPGSDAGRVFLGIALARQGDLGEARELLKEIAETPGSSAAALAEASLAALPSRPVPGFL
jgi:hypothetical protein